MVPKSGLRRPSGTRIREARRSAGLTVMRLADLAGMHHQTIRKYEDGRRPPTRRGGAKIARALGIETSDLYDDPDDEEAEAA